MRCLASTFRSWRRLAYPTFCRGGGFSQSGFSIVEVHHEFQDRRGGGWPTPHSIVEEAFHDLDSKSWKSTINFKIVEVFHDLEISRSWRSLPRLGSERMLRPPPQSVVEEVWRSQHEDGEDGKEEERVDKNCLAVGCEAAEFNVAVVAGYLEYEAGGEEYK
ncbi:hypothetical protein Q3G72_023652 [Acer saccharum]|nr:hypothetical protein Q3G72_023652 [Acer saccharum]